MIYLDTSCLLKLYYREPDSARVAALVAGQPIAVIALHELEFVNALELKLHRKEATTAQVRATAALFETDIRAGLLYRPSVRFDDLWRDAAQLAKTHTRALGCRSLDILHCAAARSLPVTAFVTTDRRQRALARKLGLGCPSV